MDAGMDVKVDLYMLVRVWVGVCKRVVVSDVFW